MILKPIFQLQRKHLLFLRQCKKQKSSQFQKVRPVLFNTDSKNMQKRMIYLGVKGHLIINKEENPELIKQLSVAKQDKDFKLMKPKGNTNGPPYDLIDALKLALMPYNIRFDRKYNECIQ